MTTSQVSLKLEYRACDAQTDDQGGNDEGSRLVRGSRLYLVKAMKNKSRHICFLASALCLLPGGREANKRFFLPPAGVISQ
jgi:hypothetical protein